MRKLPSYFIFASADARADLDGLDLLLDRLESAPSQAVIIELLARAAAAHPQPGNAPVERFITFVAKPYACGEQRPLFTADFPDHWRRFKTLWDRMEPRLASAA